MEVFECLHIIEELFQSPKYSKLTITSEAYIKLMCYINLVGDYEVNGFGRVIDDKIVDFKILQQTVNRSTVLANEQSIFKFMSQTPRDQLKEWILDWHSHVTFSPEPSRTDLSNYELMKELRGNQQFPYLIINKYGQYTCRNYINEYREKDIQLVLPSEQELSNIDIQQIYEQCKQEVEQKCSKIVTVNKKGGFYENYSNNQCGISQTWTGR